MITIQEDYSLPSKGLIYDKQFDPEITLRSMTVAEEMKRLTITEYPYKNMSAIIDACLVTKLPISAYDMCLGDYQYLLHKLRTVTYGPVYDIDVYCAKCGEVTSTELNLDDLEVIEYDGSFDELKYLLLYNGDQLELTFQTPRALDEIEKKKKQFKKKFPEADDQTLVFNLASVIKSVNGEPANPFIITDYIKTLGMKDCILILNRACEMNKKVGLNTQISVTCANCQSEVSGTFRYTDEFFRPSNV